MRQIGSQEEEAKRRKRTAQIFSIILLGLLVLSTVGYAFFSNPDTTSNTPVSSGNTAVQQTYDGQWAFDFGGRQILLTTSPDEAKNISFKAQPSLVDFTQQIVYIDASDSISNIIANALSPYASRVQAACYGSCTRDLPEHDCNDTLIVWNNSANQQIYKQDKCYFIDGDKRAVDAFIYGVFGMLKS